MTGNVAGSLLVALAVSGLVVAAPSLAAPASPHWSIVSESEPTYFKAGDPSDAYVLVVRNDGALPTSSGNPVSVTDALPAKVTTAGAVIKVERADGGGLPEYESKCPPEHEGAAVTCTYEEGSTGVPVLPGATIVVTVDVSVPAEITSLEPNVATVSGGGAPSATTSETTPIDPDPVPFGLAFFDLDTAQESGEAATQAGSHPFELTASLGFTVAARETGGDESPLADAAAKDLEVALPPGLVGDPQAVPRCSQREFLERETLNCPLDTQVGIVKPLFYGTFHPAYFPVYDVVPPPGQTAELGFSVGVGRVPLFLHVRGDVSDPGDGGYELTGSLDDIPESGPLQGAILTLWGVPAAGSHDLEREGTVGEGNPGESCQPSVAMNEGREEPTGCPSGAPPKPFLTLPSECESGRGLAVHAFSDSWEQPGDFQPAPAEPLLAEAITGCEALSFAPTLTLAPETTQAAAPSGYTLDVHVPQDEDPSALATPDLREAAVTLPAGVVLSPSVANGLEACSHGQFEPPPAQPSPPLGSSPPPAACPPRSQIGTVKITTPLLSSPLEGELFLGEPECASCTPADAREGKLIRLLVQAQGSGVTIKLEGSASIDQATGQLTASFQELPQLPFEDVQLTLDGGADAPLANSPTACGTPLSASSQLTPYSGETPAAPSSEPFALGDCPPPRFQPSFTAGTTNNQAGAFSPLTVTLSRGDQEEDVERVSVQLPPGLLAMLSKVDLCPAAQAQAGTCGPQSEIGTATVGAGPGPSPLFLTGTVYLTGPREGTGGAPFGLSIVVPAVAGPLNLGTIELGASIEVAPGTAELTITSDPLPQALDGIPLQIKTINLDIDREGFVFNPTDCRALAIEGALTSTAGATTKASSRFQAANCATLSFKPKLTALTHAHASKAGGVHLHVRIAFAPGQANIAQLKLDLPKRTVPRLSTLQKACTVTVFDANPSSCPPASVVGAATVLTPIVRQPLSGPVYVLSRGRGASPEIALVLQGEGVTVEVVGQTKVQDGVESVAFRSLPDAPISELDVLLDAGPHSLLAANLPAKLHGNMCARRLSMPTEITGQNGAVVKQTTVVSVSGCPKPERKAGGHKSDGGKNAGRKAGGRKAAPRKA
ncbi:MAG TPA: hypothetical protein VMF09_17085 [Solirubrobacteraceae bacterium]|nr:hypothetical protein [Solirubrobacteraceae bacterium]